MFDNASTNPQPIPTCLRLKPCFACCLSLCVQQSAATGPELFVEVLGTLASTCDAVPAGSNGAFDWSNILSRCDIVGLLQAYLAPGALEDDAALEAVVLVGAVCGDAAVAPAVAASEVVSGCLAAHAVPVTPAAGTFVCLT